MTESERERAVLIEALTRPDQYVLRLPARDDFAWAFIVSPSSCPRSAGL